VRVVGKGKRFRGGRRLVIFMEEGSLRDEKKFYEEFFFERLNLSVKPMKK